MSDVKESTLYRPADCMPTEMGAQHAFRNYTWRLMGLVFTFAPLSALYVVALVLAHYRQHSSPKTALAIAVVTLIAVVGACFATGAMLNAAVGSMPREVKWVLKPLIALGAVLATVVAIPAFVVAEIFH